MIELIGFEKEYSDLLKRYKSNNLPNSILIHGLSGIGKRTFLNKLVKNINFEVGVLSRHLLFWACFLFQTLEQQLN
jgi:putative ribosome biogenesis GTPase RsgA